MQESTFELMARTTLLDVETTVLAAAKRILLDTAQEKSSDTGSSFFGSLFGADAAKDEGQEKATAVDMDTVREARGEALLILAQIYAQAKSKNPDPYSWRTAFAQAASAGH